MCGDFVHNIASAGKLIGGLCLNRSDPAAHAELYIIFY